MHIYIRSTIHLNHWLWWHSRLSSSDRVEIYHLAIRTKSTCSLLQSLHLIRLLLQFFLLVIELFAMASYVLICFPFRVCALVKVLFTNILQFNFFEEDIHACQRWSGRSIIFNVIVIFYEIVKPSLCPLR